MKKIILQFSMITIVLSSCEDKVRIFELEDVTIQQTGIDKPNVKTTIEFISIAYSDLFGRAISNAELVALAQSYDSFGDTKLIEDLIIRNFLNNSAVLIPSDGDMRGNIAGFVTKSYRKFFNRDPNEYELWFLVTDIEENAAITPELIYYAMMTSNEYRNF